MRAATMQPWTLAVLVASVGMLLAICAAPAQVHVLRGATRLSARPDTTVVYGPATFDAPYTYGSGTQWTYYEENFSISPLDTTRRYIFRISNGDPDATHRVCGVDLSLNGHVIASGSDVTGTVAFAVKLVPPPVSKTMVAGVNTMVVGVKSPYDPNLEYEGDTDAHISFDLISTPDPTYEFHGPTEYVMEEIPDPPPPGGGYTEYTDSLSRPSTAVAPYTVVVANGAPDGSQRVQSARVHVNGSLVVAAPECGSGTVRVTRQVSLSAQNEVKVQLTGDPGDYVNVSFTATDTTAPLVTVATPGADTVTKADGIRFLGSVTEDETGGTVRVNEQTAFAIPGSFSDSVALTTDGRHLITVHAVNGAGYGTDVSRMVIRDTRPPAVTASLSSGDSTATSMPVDSLTITWADSTLTRIFVDGDSVASGTEGTTRIAYGLDPGPNGIWVQAVDLLGNAASVKRYVYRTPTEATAPRDSVAFAATPTGVSDTELTAFRASIGFLYRGAEPTQVIPDTTILVSGTEAVVRGRVLARDYGPIPNVRVDVLGHEEFGSTFTRNDGCYDLVLNGGRPFVLRFTKDQFLEAQRHVEVPVQDIAAVDDVALIGRSARSIYVDADSGQMVVGRAECDTSGDRRLRMLISPATRCSVVTADNTLTVLSQFHIRLKEYTVGNGGPQAMPGTLPPSTAYTYCIDMSVDEALALKGADDPMPEVTFSQPLVTYVKEFLGLPVGTAVPSGYYDTRSGKWRTSEDGVVLRILGISGSQAIVDSDGDSLGDAQTRLDSLGVTSAELVQLASLYALGDVVWRTRIRHFSSQDFNLNKAEADNAAATSAARAGRPMQLADCPTEKQGCVIELENRVLGETIPVTGTPFSLNYRSNRQPGDIAMRYLRIPIVGAKVPDGARRVILQVDVAGRRYTQDFPPMANQVVTFDDWDGKDVYGRPVLGTVPATVRIGLEYSARYSLSTPGSGAFGNSATTSETNSMAAFGPRDVGRIEWTTQRVSLGAPSMASAGLGGWTLSPHHFYDAIGDGTVYRGDGSAILGFRQYPILTVFAGTGTPPELYSLRCYDGEPATTTDRANFGPQDIAVGDSGSVYFTDSGAHAVGRVTREGLYYRFAGNSAFADGDFVADGSMANATKLGQPHGIAIAPDGSAVFTDLEYKRVYRVTDGRLYLVAGNPNGVTQEDTLATAYKFAAYYDPTSVAVGPDGAIYVGTLRKIYRVSPDGRIRTFAGTGSVDVRGGTAGPVGKATEIAILGVEDMVCDREGALYFTEHDFDRIRRIGVDGRLTTYYFDFGRTLKPRSICLGADGLVHVVQYHGGGGSSPWASVIRIDPDSTLATEAGTPNLQTNFLGQNGQFARAAGLANLTSAAIGPDGTLYIGEHATNAGNSSGIYRVARELPGGNEGKILYPSEDGAEIYVFSATGQHLRTEDVVTRVVKYRFEYDADGRLALVRDANGDSTTIDRNGQTITITAPRGQETTLTLDAEGFLGSVENPAHEAYGLSYWPGGGGLLATLESPRHNQWHYTFNASDGRLDFEEDPAGGSTSLVAVEAGLSRTTTSATAETRTTRYDYALDGAGWVRRAIRHPDGSVDSLREGMLYDGMTSYGQRTWRHGASGDITTTQPARDGRFSWFAPVDSVVTVALPSGKILTLTRSRLADGSKFYESTALNGQRALVTYDTTTRLLSARSAAGRQVTLQLDGAGRVASLTGLGQTAVSLGYDAHGRLIHVGQGGRTWALDYSGDAKGRLHSVTDTLGRVSTLGYDDADRVVSVAMPGGRMVGGGYDARGNLTSLTPPGDSSHAFGYTPVDLAESYAPPAVPGIVDPTTRYTYNRDRQLTQVTRPDGTLIRAVYGASTGRLDSLSQARGRHEFSYDARGRLENLTSPDSVGLRFTYDGPLLLGETWLGLRGSGSEDEVARQVDIAFRDSIQTVRGGSPARFSYDADGLLTGITLNGTPVAAITRRPDNGAVSGVVTGAVWDSLSYNSHGELWTLEYGWPGGAFRQILERDSLGRIVSVQETAFGADTLYGYRYDEAGRLYAVTTNGDTTARYWYDANGNRDSAAVRGVVTTADYDAQDRLTRYGATTYGYTAAGELCTAVTGADTTRYTYDALGNLLKVKFADGDSVEYVVDGLNRRVGRKVNGAWTTRWLYADELRPVAELDSAGAVVARYLYGSRDHVPDLVVRGDATYRVITDQLGSVRGLVDVATGQVVERVDYDACGVPKVGGQPGPTTLGYAGGLRDTLTGLVRFGVRDYEPKTGRWTSKDPVLFFGGSGNVYEYVRSNPINSLDPLGLACKKSYFDRVVENFLVTNEALPEVLHTVLELPVGVKLGQAVDAPTLVDWAWRGFPRLISGPATFTRLESAVIATSVSIGSLALTTLAFETGIAVGSLVNAAIVPSEPITDDCPCAREDGEAGRK